MTRAGPTTNGSEAASEASKAFGIENSGRQAETVGWVALTVVTDVAVAAVVVTSPAWVTAAGVSALIGIGVTVGVGSITDRFDPMTAAVNGVAAAAVGGYSAAAGGLGLVRVMGLEALGAGVGDAVLQVVSNGRALNDLSIGSIGINTGGGRGDVARFDG